MKTIKTFSLLFTLVTLFSCSSNQVEKSITESNCVHGSITISPLDSSTISKLVNIDTTHPQISDNNRPPAGTTYTWTIYLPFSDSLKLHVTDVNGNLIHESPVKLMEQGFYRLSIYPDLRIDKDGVYVLKAAFCGSSFAKKFLILK